MSDLEARWAEMAKDVWVLPCDDHGAPAGTMVLTWKACQDAVRSLALAVLDMTDALYMESEMMSTDAYAALKARIEALGQ